MYALTIAQIPLVIVLLFIGTLISLVICRLVMGPIKQRRSDRDWEEKKRYWRAEGINL